MFAGWFACGCAIDAFGWCLLHACWVLVVLLGMRFVGRLHLWLNCVLCVVVVGLVVWECLCTFTLMWFGFLFGPAWILLVCLLLGGLLFDLVLAGVVLWVFGVCYFLWFGTCDLSSLGWLLRLFTVLCWMFWMLSIMI